MADGFVHPATMLSEMGGRARKRFGHNFLAAEGVVHEIVAAAGVGPGDRVVEVGPGLGVLTGALLARGCAVTAVELDRDLIGWLETRFAGPLAEGRFRLVHADAAKVDWAELAPGTGWTFVSNLPYNVGTRITTRLLAMPARFPRLVVMLQKEVGLRMMATADDRARGSLSVYVEARATATTVRKVPPGCFYPPPKVHSIVIRLDARPLAAALGGPAEGDAPDAPAPLVSLDALEEVCKVAFAAPRKTVRKGLSARWPRDVVAGALAAAGVDDRRRPATLRLAEWVAVATALQGGSVA